VKGLGPLTVYLLRETPSPATTIKP
jgi:hypothetical protein